MTEKIFCNKRKTLVYSIYKPTDTVENHDSKKTQHTRPDPLARRKHQEAMEGSWNCFKLNKLYSASHLECCVLFWAPQNRWDKGPLEQVQKRETQNRSISHNKRLRELIMLSFKKKRLRGDLINIYSIWRGWTRLFSVVLSNRIRGNRQKLMHTKFHLNMRKNVFTV